ncbi:hypothetical protein QQ045_019347 [Rhodiola kirilowii]
MGICHGKPMEHQVVHSHNSVIPTQSDSTDQSSITPPSIKKPSSSSGFPFFNPSQLNGFFSNKNSPLNSASSSLNSTPNRFFKRPFPPPSPARHIKALLARRRGGNTTVKHDDISAAENGFGNDDDAEEFGLEKHFGYSKHFSANYELGDEVGRGHFGYTCKARGRKGSFKGQDVAVKIISKSKMTTAIGIEDVRREVKMLRALKGFRNMVQFYDAYEDDDNVYIVMELCKGGELLDRILARGGQYSEEDAKQIIVQILNVAAFYHLQGVVHRDLKPENFLFATKEENSTLKAIDFGLSDYIKPDERLNDIVGSAYYVAPEVLHRSYGTEADMWSIGVIAYILLSGSRPFWARTESGIFRAVVKAAPSFDETPWISLSPNAVDFVKRLLHKDFRKRLTAAQALCHPWLEGSHDIKIPLDIVIFRLVKSYICSSPLRKSALQAVAKTLTEPQIVYLREQFALLGPSKTGCITLQNFRMAATRYATDAMKDSHVADYVNMVSCMQYGKMGFEEFCAAAISVHQLEGMETWEQHALYAYEFFEMEGNRLIMIDELALELGLSLSIPFHVVLRDLIRPSDGKLSFFGFVRLLHGVSSKPSSQKAQY